MNVKDELKRINALSAFDTLNDPAALEMLQNFLQKLLNGDKSLIAQYVEIYGKCNEHLKQNDGITENDFEELCELGLPIEIELGKVEIIKSGGKKRCALLILEQLCKKIEGREEYTKFREHILSQVQYFTQ